jgi:hypothetical protein
MDNLILLHFVLNKQETIKDKKNIFINRWLTLISHNSISQSRGYVEAIVSAGPLITNTMADLY